MYLANLLLIVIYFVACNPEDCNNEFTDFEEGGFKVTYGNKRPTIGGKPFNAFFRNDSVKSNYEKHFTYLQTIDTIAIDFLSSFLKDTISVFYNKILVYENIILETDRSWGYAGHELLGFNPNNECDSIGIKINNSKIYYAPLSKDYIKVNIYYIKGKIELEFSNNFSLLM